MTLDHIYCPATILKLRGLNLREKLLLSLAFKFGENGLHVSNAELGELLDVLPSWVSDLLCSLERKGYIEMTNRQSRHRVIYFRPKPKVGTELLPAKTESKKTLLPVFTPSTSGESRNKRKKVNRERERNGGKTFVIPTLAEIESYIAEKRLSVNAQRFLDYFTESGWVDSNGNKVRSWRQKLLTWDNHAKPAQTLGGNGEPTHDASDEEIAELQRQGVFDG